MSVQRCQKETTSTEFLEWLDYFAIELGVPKREHYYLAQIACEVRRGILKDPRDAKVEDFMMKRTQTDKEPDKPLTEEEQQARMARSKQAWLGLTQALAAKGKVPTRTPPRTPPRKV